MRAYYSRRNNENPNILLTLDVLKKLFFSVFNDFENKGYFQESFGFYCDDMGQVSGALGHDIAIYILKILHKDNIWPINSWYLAYNEDDLFDVIEFLFDVVSAPIEKDSDYHSYNNCGWHYSNFDKIIGQSEFVTAINEILVDYKGGYELSPNGEIWESVEAGLEPIFDAVLETEDENIHQAVEHAISKYRKQGTTIHDRRDAIKQLGYILEPMRGKVKAILTKDESDLFEILNKFGFRHNNGSQKLDYDSPIFDAWLFYHYLSAIHAYLRLLNREKSAANN